MFTTSQPGQIVEVDGIIGALSSTLRLNQPVPGNYDNRSQKAQSTSVENSGYQLATNQPVTLQKVASRENRRIAGRSFPGVKQKDEPKAKLKRKAYSLVLTIMLELGLQMNIHSSTLRLNQPVPGNYDNRSQKAQSTNVENSSFPLF